MIHTTDTLKFYMILYPLSALLLGAGAGYFIQQGSTDQSIAEVNLRPTISQVRESSSGDLRDRRLSPFQRQASITNAEQAKQAMHRALVTNHLSSVEAQALLDWAKESPKQALDFFLKETPTIRASRLRNAAFEILLGQLGIDQVESQILSLEDKGRQQAMLRNLFCCVS